MSNTTFAAAAGAILLAHLAALGWGIWRSGRVMLWLNAVVAAGAIGALILQHPGLAWGGDTPLQALLGFEVVVLALAAMALRGVPVAWWLSMAGFALHLCAAAGMLVFALTFRITRLF
ncbi:hypothetical protein ACQW02_18280 [Humitalea sp. 24SJ18S-53]|uniref:hypothetical protein n=1 Tax=Humitalea sp. 24SJ18S-53 TaxID=3422307 RepID=UPI003D679424